MSHLPPQAKGLIKKAYVEHLTVGEIEHQKDLDGLKNIEHKVDVVTFSWTCRRRHFQLDLIYEIYTLYLVY